jgi:UDP-glucose 4-epimerase
MDAWRPDAVVHCAGLIEVAASVKRPLEYYDVNVGGTRRLLEQMDRRGIGAFVFSSTCAVYGEPERLPLREDHPCAPLSPYGWSKLMAERISVDHAAATAGRFAHLRYFNAAGAACDEGIGERHDPETHAIPLVLFTLLGRRERFSVYGRDYPTRDGTCLRDYVHVADLADAHVLAVERLLGGGDSVTVNLGTGEGATVLELLAAAERVTGRRPNWDYAERRPGDPAALVADGSAAFETLGWRARRGVETVISDAWTWHSRVEPVLFGPGA